MPLLKPNLRSVALCCLVAGALAGCDTGEPEATQGTEEAASQSGTEQLGGTLDRSFAGEPIPAVELTDPSGTTLQLDETQGKPVLLNLWATWCAPCVVEMPLLDELASDMGDDVRVLTVSEDLQGAEVVEPFFEEKGFDNLPRWMDPQNDLAIEFGGGAVLPLTVLYDAEGQEVWRVIGGYDWGSEEARELVREGLAGDG